MLLLHTYLGVTYLFYEILVASPYDFQPPLSWE